MYYILFNLQKNISNKKLISNISDSSVFKDAENNTALMPSNIIQNNQDNSNYSGVVTINEQLGEKDVILVRFALENNFLFKDKTDRIM